MNIGGDVCNISMSGNGTYYSARVTFVDSNPKSCSVVIRNTKGQVSASATSN